LNDEDISSSTNREFQSKRKRREGGNEIEEKKKILYVYISHLNGSIIAFKKNNDDLVYTLAAAKIAVTD